ncbi:MAG TPA: hypothetical protein DEV81_17465 [Cyanobacteria bacterium UBA11049]|nr:hypothetical protein [Cyanobacteria bacterium UBA11049]
MGFFPPCVIYKSNNVYLSRNQSFNWVEAREEGNSNSSTNIQNTIGTKTSDRHIYPAKARQLKYFLFLMARQFLKLVVI